MFLGTGSKIIGERINPTGKKRFKQALKEHDLDYILKEGIAQQDNFSSQSASPECLYTASPSLQYVQELFRSIPRSQLPQDQQHDT